MGRSTGLEPSDEWTVIRRCAFQYLWLSVVDHLCRLDGRDAHGADFHQLLRDHCPSDNITAVLVSVAHKSTPRFACRDQEQGCVGPRLRAGDHKALKGKFEVGTFAGLARCISAHRDLAFTVCRELVEQVKARLPVWKKQVVADGSHTWVGSA